MITNSSSIGSGPVPGPDPRRSRPASAGSATPAASDRVSTERAAGLDAAIASSPAVRPEVVARAQALAVDPSYPPLQIIERVARLIADSQDLSEIPD